MNFKITVYLTVLVIISVLSPVVFSQEKDKLVLEHTDQFEVILENESYLTFATGNVRFKTETGYIYCDSAVWRKGESVKLNGNVLVDDDLYNLRSDSVFYNTVTKDALALGDHVELWSYEDSLYAAGKHAFYNREREYFFMEERPILYINYPDTATMIEVISDYLEYNAADKKVEATGEVKITSKDVTTYSDCAVLMIESNNLDLFDNPKVIKGNSEIIGELISVYFDNKILSKIDVIDSATANFVEPIDSTETDFDRSILSGNRIIFNFKHGILDNVICYGQAYSWYYPSTRGGKEHRENTVSGDTIRFLVYDERLESVEVVGGAIGTYMTGKISGDDSVIFIPSDTVAYNARYLEYSIEDSLITLNHSAHVVSGTVSLDAHLIYFYTGDRLIEAFSAELDSTASPQSEEAKYARRFQPNNVPVILKDKSDQIFGDYLLYSTETEKGRIVQSKSSYQQGFYYGEKLFREQKRIFYVNDGRYTTCDAEEPHFHFHSPNMKLIEGDKLIAKPVIFYIERLPIFALPYYVFPLKRGRHSGFLPFTFGQFDRGDRYVKNVGYYWAASEFWDWQGSFDYHENNQNLTFNTKINFNKRYLLKGYVSGSYLRDTDYDSYSAQEIKRNRWTLNGSYNHIISPSFNISAYGDFVSDETYYSDYSLNQEDLLNRSMKSQASFSKVFGKSTSLSGSFSHTVNLDDESRTDNIPTSRLSLPTIWPFGNGKINEEGNLEQKWYNRISFRYSPSLINYSSRITKDSSIIVDTDTTVFSYRSRRHYAKISHNPSINLPTVKLGNYMNIVPSFNYSETWFKIYETDQSLNADIDASTTYRTYSYRTSVSANTTVYGTVYPNIIGLTGLRHVINPSVSYSFSPEINRHPEIRSFAGGGAGSNKSSVVSFSVNQTFQAKVKKGETEKNLDLLSITSRFSYNFENEDYPYSNLNTSFQSRALGRITFNGSMTHSFYKPGTNDVDFWSPYLQSFNINAKFSIAGNRFLFDDDVPRPQPSQDTTFRQSPVEPISSSDRRNTGWNFSATYNYSESGRGEDYTKRSFIDFSLSFALTPNTTIGYSQYYDINQQLTIRNSVNIVKNIHCWKGSLYWVPIGSNRGFGFKLYVTAIPEIKIDNNHDSFLQSVQR